MLPEEVKRSIIDLLFSLDLTNDELMTLNEGVALKYGYNKPYEEGGIIESNIMNDHHVDSLIEGIVDFIEMNSSNGIEVTDEGYQINHQNVIELDGYSLMVDSRGADKLNKVITDKLTEFGYY